MKNKKKLSVLFSLLLVGVMMIGTSISAFAVENSEYENTMTNYSTTFEYIIDMNNSGMTTYGNIMDSGIVPRYGSLDLRPSLSSYVGVTRKFSVCTNPTLTTPATGELHMTLRKPNGDSLDSWKMKAGENVMKTYTLPSSGYYTLEITSNVNMPVEVVAAWAA